MKRIIGIGIGILYLFIAAGALRTGATGRSAGQEDIAFWWTVIGVLLLVAGIAAFAGTLMHSRRVRE